MGKPGIQYQVVDISSQPDFASKFGINGLPTLLVLDAQDKELHRQTGYINKMLVCNTLGISN
jgi:thioredoxin-related protein